MFLLKKDILLYVDIGLLIIRNFNKNSLKSASYSFSIDQELIMKPNEFKVVDSKEEIEFPDNIIGLLSVRNSIAKKGVDLLNSDYVIEPNSKGKLSFCVKNNSNEEVIIDTETCVVKCIFLINEKS